jgi:hypothetical protein
LVNNFHQSTCALHDCWSRVKSVDWQDFPELDVYWWVMQMSLLMPNMRILYRAEIKSTSVHCTDLKIHFTKCCRLLSLIASVPSFSFCVVILQICFCEIGFVIIVSFSHLPSSVISRTRANLSQFTFCV